MIYLGNVAYVLELLQRIRVHGVGSLQCGVEWLQSQEQGRHPGTVWVVQSIVLISTLHVGEHSVA